MVRREFKHQLLRNFELALYSERIQRLKKEKKSLVTTARNIYRAAGATLRSSVVVLLGFSLVMLAYGCSSYKDKPQCHYIMELHYLNSEMDTIFYNGSCKNEPYIYSCEGAYNLHVDGWHQIAVGVNRFKILEKTAILTK